MISQFWPMHSHRGHPSGSAPVLNQDILNNNCVERPVDYLQKVMEALGSFTREKSCQNVAFFVDECAEQVETVLEAHDSLD
jgi:hypothetical protein